jgi:hypothetical protein
MSEELHLWWSDLCDAQRMYYCGQLELLPQPWLERMAREYNDLDQRVWRPFNAETMRWAEYVKTSDYLVHNHHRLKERLLAEENEHQIRVHLNEAHGKALSDAMATQDETFPDCDGCRFNESSQRFHQCLGYE